MIHLTLMPASISSASRIGHHCAPAALSASSSPNTRARSNNLAFVFGPLSGVLWDQLLRASARTAADRDCWVFRVGALGLPRVVCAVAWFAGAGGGLAALQQAVRADGQTVPDVLV